VKTLYRELIEKTAKGCFCVLETSITGDVAESEGMVCGGIMRVLIEDDV
jgi:xanthine dehydrogenase accessory factor